MRLVQRRLVEVAFDLRAEAPAVAKLIERYADLPASLADACLVRLAELHPGCSVLTTDIHFHVYRANRRKPIGILSPG